nr:hypothetical protein [uncultured Carboxylicivirga sp.]
MTNILVERINSARKGINPTVITKMESGWVVLGDNQTIPGYCLLLGDPIIDDISKLDKENRKQFLYDMTVIGDALMNVLNVKKINYSVFDNLNIGLHAHIHPRYEWEIEEFKKSPPWKYGFMKVPTVELDIEKNKLLIQIIKNEIERLK